MGRVDDLEGLVAEGMHHGRPGQVQVRGGLDDGGAGAAYPAPGSGPQPCGDPRVGQAVQVEQQRRIAVQARGFWMIVLRREQK
ncbi:hypothetical protein ABZ892_10705 [Streptomyces sp. NPDC046924]|uniref:hypothetical protein n=1 Tax=Streptomyces sp. NPDC046924 TaxID=3155136 RepID=UPI0033D6685B